MSSNNKNSVKKFSFHEVEIKPKNKELTSVKLLSFFSIIIIIIIHL